MAFFPSSLPESLPSNLIHHTFPSSLQSYTPILYIQVCSFIAAAGSSDDRTSPTTHTQEWEHWKSHIGSIGKLLPNMEAKFVDEEGNEVPHGKDGELWMRGPNVFKGYLNNDEATKNSITEDGWFKSGDVGHVDEDG